MDLDLVEVAAEANPPVCRIMDYNRFKYEAAQRAKESRRKATSTGIKEMKYRPKIGIGDFDTKTRQVARFLGEGHKVKITIMFRGREMSHPELGKRILDQVAESGGCRRQGGGGAQARRPQHDHGAGPRPAGAGRKPPTQQRRPPAGSPAARGGPETADHTDGTDHSDSTGHAGSTGADRAAAPAAPPAPTAPTTLQPATPVPTPAGGEDAGPEPATAAARSAGDRPSRPSTPSRSMSTAPGHSLNDRPSGTDPRPEESIDMPKMKTDRGAAKRFKITGSGRLRRRQLSVPTSWRRSRAPAPGAWAARSTWPRGRQGRQAPARHLTESRPTEPTAADRT